MRKEQQQDLIDMGFNPKDYLDLSDKEVDDFLEIIAHEPLLVLSLCCGTEVDEDGFCLGCGEQA